MWGSSREYHLAKDYVEAATVYRPIVTPGDRILAVPAEAVVQAPAGDCALLCDTYAAGPNTLFLALQTMPFRVVAVCHKRLNGLFGDAYGEGCFFRDAPGSVIYHPDGASVYHHDPLDWLNVDGECGNISWSTFKTFGLESITYVTILNRPLVNPPPPAEELGVTRAYAPPKSWTRQTLIQLCSSLPDPIWRQIVRRTCAIERYDARLLQALRAYCFSRRCSVYTYQGLEREGLRVMQDLYPVFYRLMPACAFQQVTRHVEAAWLDVILANGALMESLSAVAPGAARYNANLDGIAETSKFSFPSWKTWCAALAVVLLLFPGLRGLVVAAMKRAGRAMLEKLHILGPASSLSDLVQREVRNQLQVVYPLAGAVSVLGKGVLPVANLGGFAGSEILEEVLREWSPAATPALFVMELINNGWRSALASFALSGLPFALRLAAHLLWNVVATRVPDTWMQYVSAVHTGRFATRGWDFERVGVSPYRLEQGWVPRERHSSYPKRPLDPLLASTVDQVLRRDRVVRGPPTLFFLPTNIPLYSASRNGHLFIAALEARILAPAPNLEGQERAFRKQCNRVPLLRYSEPPIDRTPDIVEDYLAHWDDPKKVRLMRLINAQFEHATPSAGDRPMHLVPQMIKVDESLPRPDFTFKPRMIANVPPFTQVAVGAQIRVASARLHDHWQLDRVVLTLHGYDLRIVYAVGLTDAELGRCLQLALDTPKIVVVCVCGDDSIVFVNSGHMFWVYENDFSSYDQSQSYAILEVEYLYLKKLGVRDDDIAYLRATAKSPYVYSDRRTGGYARIKRLNRTMRDTGGPDTSLGNSILNAHVWALVLRDGGVFQSAEALTLAFLRYGFKAKVRVSQDWELAGFLKGKWFRSGGTFTWAPCPSRILKMGKTASDPRSAVIPSLYDAVLDFAAGLAATYSLYSQVPLIRAFVQRFAVAGHATAHRQLEKMVVGTCLRLNDPLREAAHYYGVDPQWFVMCETYISSCPLPSLLEHPLFRVLSERDYG
jgi:hypothetical protein